LIVHHTDCGSLHYTSDEVRETLKQRDPELKGLEHDHFGAIADLEQSVKNDVASLRDLKVMREELKPAVQGFVYDIKNGKLTLVAE
jgi:carbonic anhydrase